MKAETKKTIALFVVLFVVLTAVYWNHFDNTFHFDDSHTIVNNSYITDIANLLLFFTDSRTESSLPENQTYRPVITTLNAIDYWIAGKLDSRVFHTHIFLEFLLLLVLLYLFMLRVFTMCSDDRHYFLALFGTALFAFHTATAETINYIIARSDGFSTLMVLASLLVYTGNVGWKKQLALVPFIIGCLAKPTTLMLAPLLIVYELLIERPSLLAVSEQPALANAFKRTLTGASSFVLVGAGMYLFTRSMYPDTWIPGGNSALEYLNTQPWVILIYLKTFVLPTGLSADTDLEVIGEILAPRVIMGLVIIAALLVLSLLAATRRKTLPVSFGILWFFLTLAPTSSVIPLAEVLNHHRTFFPYIGLVIAATWCFYLFWSWLPRKLRHRPPAKIALVTICLAFLSAHAYGTWQRNTVWDSGLSLWQDVTIKSPGNGRGWMNYGLARMRVGDYEAAIESYQRARQTNYGRHPYLFVNLGIATNALAERDGDSSQKNAAESYFKTAILFGDRYPQTHYFYADWLHRNGRSEEAIPLLHKALELSPAHKEAWILLQKVNVEAQGSIEAKHQLAESVGTAESFLDLSLDYYRLKRWEDCISAASRALQINPEYAAAYNNICAARNEQGKYELAIGACEKALQLQPDYPLALGNLNWAKKQLSEPD